MNCTAELFCAGKCVGDTLWNCGSNINNLIILVGGVLVFFFIWIILDDVMKEVS